jgi:hypothetical protein
MPVSLAQRKDVVLDPGVGAVAGFEEVLVARWGC